MLPQDVIASAEKRIGETIGGKWHLDRVIGVGGMAVVYEATHRNRNRVAIKLLHPALSLDEGTRHRFLREGYVANTIRHSGAVQVLDDDVTSDGYAFLVMELLRGESVEERLTRKGGVLDAAEALSIADQLLEVLDAAHDQGVVHRDIKPDNLFLTEEGKLKVLDFGIARLAQGNSRATKVGSFMGTPAFCAQEQARGRWDEVDHRTDLYSVGATLFTCLTGKHVHEAETSSEQLALAIGAVARSLAEVLPGAPQELVELVDTSLAYDKEDRFQSARAMKAAVNRVRAGLPLVRRIPSPAPPRGAATFGSAELDPESMRQSGIVRKVAKKRVAAGILVAAALAGGITALSTPSQVAEDSASSAAFEKPPATPALPVFSAPSPEPSTPNVGPAIGAAPAIAGPNGAERAAGAGPQAPPASAVAKSNAAPSPPLPRSHVPASHVAEEPSPALGDEQMFDRRF